MPPGSVVLATGRSTAEFPPNHGACKVSASMDALPTSLANVLPCSAPVPNRQVSAGQEHMSGGTEAPLLSFV
jgi:hypothetical protein